MAGGSEDYDHLYKVILVGDATVGKTHLLSRYIRGTLPKSPKATIGVEFATRTVPLAVGGTVKAQASACREKKIFSAL
ncbi:Rab11b [Toxoplasma gondii FOU]|uniref:Rab11b n=1 Tax=Toxoplasma gondii FOU TaxID=943167 RepID=A0A086KG52_TOXGO|nr:Rab11b [Toxoplasma gondii FOU]